MGEKWDKFLLLMWKNWLLQYRRPVQTVIEILAPVIFSILLVIIRGQADPKLQQEKIYSPFCTFPFAINWSTSDGHDLCPNVDEIMNGTVSTNGTFSNIVLVYSPNNTLFDKVMDLFKPVFNNVRGVANARELQRNTLNPDFSYIGIEFPDKYAAESGWENVTDLSVALRFPSETNFKLDNIGNPNWFTNLIYPIFQSAGPRSPDYTTGSAPSYFKEQFLFLQHYLTVSMILAQNNYTLNATGLKWLYDNDFPWIYMRRFPYAEWYSDVLLTAIEGMLGLIIMLSFVYTCINTVKSITTEKEKQLKESMKIMGLPNWLHWMAWFIKCFVYLLISIVLMITFLKVKFYDSSYTVFTYSDAGVLFVFFVLYAISTITFCFALSVFFSKANTAATIAGLAWFLSYAPFLFMQNNYADLTLFSKLLASMATNTAMAFGFQVVLMYEGTGDGISWDKLFTPNSPDDTLTLGYVWIMLVINSLMYLFIALYVEAVFPGEYGVPEKWYFLFTKTYWCGESVLSEINYNSGDIIANDGEFFEPEPVALKAGIKITNLRKEYGRKTAVRNLSLNLFEDQITVLLGHNGAGKSTTMSMLTGMTTPTSGTAEINGYDIRHDMSKVRNSLGLCPQHNIIFDDLTVSEHLYFFSKLKGLEKNEIVEEIDKYVKLLDLEPKRNVKSSTLSGGMKRKLCVGIALCGNSKVVMLDEPTAGMDPSARRILWELLQKQKEGRTILLTTHFMDEADILGDRIAIMAGGKLQCCGSSFFLKKKYGAGYTLIMDKTKDCDASKVTDLLRRYIPDIQIESNVGSELSYQLTENYASAFEALLKQLEFESDSLGVRSYGISLTTLEEVFMKVGADHGQEEENDEKENKTSNKKDITNTFAKTTTSLAPSYTGGMHLIRNQLLALTMKKVLATYRSWILLLIQLCIPLINMILTLTIPNASVSSEGLPPMPLDLTKFKNPVTLVNLGEYSDFYESVLNQYGLQSTEELNITEKLLYLTQKYPNTVRRRYIIGASFEQLNVNNKEIMITLPALTAWFNNDPYHSPGISLGFLLSAVYKKFNHINDSLKFINKPLPYKAETQFDRINSGQSQGFQLAFNICFSLAFVSSFYVIFLVREKASKSKHLQFVSGVKIYAFWLVHAFCDMLTYLMTVFVLLVTLVSFQQEGFKTAEEIGVIFAILLYFGVAMFPCVYLSSYYFDVPSTGYTRLTLLSIFTGCVTFLVITILAVPQLDLTNISDILDWPFLLFPHYSLATGINGYYTKYQTNKICDKYYTLCKGDTSMTPTCMKLASTCDGANKDYFSWEKPGIGRNVIFSLISGVLLFALLLIIEYELFARIIYYLEQKFKPKSPVPVEDEDDDVAKEKELVRNSDELDLRLKHSLVIKDLTKYYKNFLAVNGLSLCVDKSECFGLLGINGAGKTTTFKMMSGDEKISYGNGWVDGKSIKTELKRVQRSIGYCPQFDALLDDMTARESITMYCLLRGIELKRTRAIAHSLSNEFDFHRHLDKKVKELSGGNKRKLSTVLSLIGDPPVIFLDEPTTGMDPGTKRYLWDALCKIRDGGKTIVLTSHSMEECEALCTRVAIMVNGNFKCLGSTQHLKSKFAEGYTLTVKVKKRRETGCDTERIERFVMENFPAAQLRERHHELLNYYIVDKSMAWSEMFGVLERAKRSDLDIEDYSLGQSSLEQVFLSFTKHQIEEED